MNVLFLNNSEVSPQSSGIQRVTTVLADEFSKNGIKCYSVFFSHNQSEPKANFEEKYLLNKKNVYEQLENILVTNKINFVICQEVVGNKLFFKNIRRAVKKIEHCKSVYCLHNTPEHIYSRPNIFA